MRKIALTAVLSLSFLTSFQLNFGNELLIEKTTEEAFKPGEHLTYKVHYGWFEAGIVDMTVDPQLHTVNDMPCYKIDVTGESSGLLYLFVKMKNHFRSYLNSNYISQKFYRDIKEGKYTKREQVIFNHETAQATVETLSDSSAAVINTEIFSVVPHIKDIAGYWYILRNLDLGALQVGDVLYSPVFFDNQIYEKFSTKFLGKRRIKTKLGYIDTFVFAPVVPFTKEGNSIFLDEKSVELFLSADKNKVPIKIKIKLVVGAVEIDLINHQGLQVPLVFGKK